MAARIMTSIDPARSLDLTGNPTWRGLQIIDTVAGGPDDDTGIVEFRATLCPAAGSGSSRSGRGSSARAVAGTTSARCDSGTANCGTYSAAIT
jgi:hypothetical protein